MHLQFHLHFLLYSSVSNACSVDVNILLLFAITHPLLLSGVIKSSLDYVWASMILWIELIYHHVVDIYARCYFLQAVHIFAGWLQTPHIIHNHITLLVVKHTSSTVSCPASCWALSLHVRLVSLELRIKHSCFPTPSLHSRLPEFGIQDEILNLSSSELFLDPFPLVLPWLRYYPPNLSSLSH
jgi:PIN domain nuclease of toxin-antitoxin system